jgi:TPR repeat protein
MAQSATDFTTTLTLQNVLFNLPANKILGRLSIVSISLLMACTALTANRAAAQTAGKKLDQCSIAIVTRKPVGSIQVCDPKAVRRLAQQGRVFEQNEMGMVSMLALGPGFDPTQALQWFEQAARKGYAPAQVNLAVMYLNGWGTPANYGNALRWLLEAADQRYARAYYNLGILYQQGQGVRQDDTEALRYFRLGAEAGDSSAQSNLGYMYDNGIGVAKDLQAAARWYRKAADNGNAFAQNNLADLYLRGEGVAQDDATAFRLFRQAASQGQTGARIKLGYMYSAGRGTAKDLVTAYTWISAASNAGDVRGHDLLQSIGSQLSASQIAQAKEGVKKLNAGTEPELAARLLQP